MKQRHLIYYAGLVAVGLLLSACSVSLAADVTPPPDYQPTQPAPATSLEVQYPIVPPNPLNGANIYADKCVACHGETGMSDGPMAGQLPEPAPALGSAEVARAARPVDWFNMVTNGNLQKLMPNFNESLSERERWDVVAYALTLSVSKETLAEGQAVFAENCQECHGDSGAGDGAQSAGINEQVPNWMTDPALLAGSSDQDLAQIINVGIQPSMPGFSNELSESQVWAVASYIRSQTFAPKEPAAENEPDPQTDVQTTAQPEAVSEAEPVEGGFSEVSGKVVNMSGGQIPADLKVRLLGYDNMEEATSAEIPVQSDGTFRFDDVKIVSGRAYLVSMDYEGITYNSDVIHPDQLMPGQSLDTLEIQYYESTTDASALTADRLHVFFEPTTEGTIQVVELLILNNTGSKVIVPAGPDQPVIKVSIPEKATNLRFQDGELGGQYIETEDGFGDLHTIIPGTGSQLLFAYEIPAERRIRLSLSVPLMTQAVVVMVPLDGLRLSSDQLTSSGEREVQDMRLNVFTAGQVPPGTSIDLTLSTGSSLFSNNTSVGLLIGGVGLGLALILAGLWYMRQRRTVEVEEEEEELPEESEETVDSLLDAIIALDDRFRAGELPEEAYEQRRAELKERLRLLQAKG